MNINDLKPASECADRFGINALIYGPARVGKTRLVLTAPNPVMISTERGALSLNDADHIPCVNAHDPKSIEEVFTWVFDSNEIKNFDTLFVDSVTAITEIYLKSELEKKSKSGAKVHGQVAYGEMGRKTLNITWNLLSVRNLNIVLIAKEEESISEEKRIKQPYFEGKLLDTKIPYDYNEILRLDNYRIPGFQSPTLALKCKGDFSAIAGDRSGKLENFEEPNLTKLFKKCLS